MIVVNTHTRIISQPKSEVVNLFKSLATNDDKVWPCKLWPKMKFRDGLKLGARGGHGPIRYKVIEYQPADLLVFEFERPIGFIGIHKFEIIGLDVKSTKLIHTIDIKTEGVASLKWLVGIRSLHDALIEDAFDKIENHYTESKKKTEWSLWVKILRKVLS